MPLQCQPVNAPPVQSLARENNFPIARVPCPAKKPRPTVSSCVVAPPERGIWRGARKHVCSVAPVKGIAAFYIKSSSRQGKEVEHKQGGWTRRIQCPRGRSMRSDPTTSGSVACSLHAANPVPMCPLGSARNAAGDARVCSGGRHGLGACPLCTGCSATPKPFPEECRVQASTTQSRPCRTEPTCCGPTEPPPSVGSNRGCVSRMRLATLPKVLLVFSEVEKQPRHAVCLGGYSLYSLLAASPKPRPEGQDRSYCMFPPFPPQFEREGPIEEPFLLAPQRTPCCRNPPFGSVHTRENKGTAMRHRHCSAHVSYQYAVARASWPPKAERRSSERIRSSAANALDGSVSAGGTQ